MRNSQRSRSRYIPIIDQRAPITAIAYRDKTIMRQGSCHPLVIPLDAGTINRTQTQHGSQWLTAVAFCIQDDPFK
jgi:hypothetical protein